MNMGQNDKADLRGPNVTAVANAAHRADLSADNVTDHIESLMTSAVELTRAYARAFTSDVYPILARAGAEGGDD